MEEKVDIREKLSEGYVRAVLIVEILGRPPEHVGAALKKILGLMQKDKNMILLNKKIYKPKKVKESRDMFTAFMEIEVLANGLKKLFEVCFDYMPSSVEVVEPTNLKFNLAQVNAIINDLASRLHKYDEVAKRFNIEKQILQGKLNDVLRGQPIINVEETKTGIGKVEAEPTEEAKKVGSIEDKREEEKAN